MSNGRLGSAVSSVSSSRSVHPVSDWSRPQRSPRNRPVRPIRMSLNDLNRAIDTCERVEASGLPNFKGCRIPLFSHWNLGAWRFFSDGFSDQEVPLLLEFGAPLSHSGKLDLCTDVCINNHQGAVRYPEQVDAYLLEEISQGAVLGPFQQSPFSQECKISPLNTVEKKESSDRRVILDLSFPPGRSVNDGIIKGQYLGEDWDLRYPSVDAFAKLVFRKGQGCLMYKRDLKRAYRQIPICPGDVRKLGYVWKGNLYLDTTLSMGVRSGALICSRVTGAIQQIFNSLGHESVVFLDDFVGADAPEQAPVAFVHLGDLLSVLGATESASKACPPHTEMVFIGVWFNSVSMTMEVTPSRLKKIMQELPSWLSRRKATRKEVERLVGVLGFVAKCVRPSRIFMSRMLNELRRLPLTGQHVLSQDFKWDVYWWSCFMPQYNGISMIPRPYWSEVNSVLATDACLSGCGAVNWVTGEYFHSVFPSDILALDLSINSLELLTIMVAIKVWGRALKSYRIKVQCDNTTAVAAVNMATLRNKHMQACMREIAFWAAIHECEVWAVHVEGVKNELPDLLSRWHLSPTHQEAFHQRNNGRLHREVALEGEFFHFSGQWT